MADAECRAKLGPVSLLEESDRLWRDGAAIRTQGSGSGRRRTKRCGRWHLDGCTHGTVFFDSLLVLVSSERASRL